MTSNLQLRFKSTICAKKIIKEIQVLDKIKNLNIIITLSPKLSHQWYCTQINGTSYKQFVFIAEASHYFCIRNCSISDTSCISSFVSGQSYALSAVAAVSVLVPVLCLVYTV